MIAGVREALIESDLLDQVWLFGLSPRGKMSKRLNQTFLRLGMEFRTEP
jgi:hypothetical protein